MAPACAAFFSTDPITMAAPVAASEKEHDHRAGGERVAPVHPEQEHGADHDQQPLHQRDRVATRASRPTRIVRTDVGEASIRRVTPKRRVSISIAEADSDVRNTNRIELLRRAGLERSDLASPPAVRVGDVHASGRAAPTPRPGQGLGETGGGAFGDREARRADVHALLVDHARSTTICELRARPPGRAMSVSGTVSPARIRSS